MLLGQSWDLWWTKMTLGQGFIRILPSPPLLTCVFLTLIHIRASVRGWTLGPLTAGGFHKDTMPPSIFRNNSSDICDISTEYVNFYWSHRQLHASRPRKYFTPSHQNIVATFVTLRVLVENSIIFLCVTKSFIISPSPADVNFKGYGRKCSWYNLR